MINGAGAVEWKEKKQVDWNENDEGSSGFVKNRIGGYTEEEVVEIELKASDFTAAKITETNQYFAAAVYKGIGEKLLPKCDIYPSFLCQESWSLEIRWSSLDGKNELASIAKRNGVISQDELVFQSDYISDTRDDVLFFDVSKAAFYSLNSAQSGDPETPFGTIPIKADENLSQLGTIVRNSGVNFLYALVSFYSASKTMEGFESSFQRGDVIFTVELSSASALFDFLSKVNQKIVLKKRTKWGIPSHYIVPTYNSYEHENVRLVADALVDPSDESCYYTFENGGTEITVPK